MKTPKKIKSWRNKLISILVIVCLLFIFYILHKQSLEMLYIKKVDTYQNEQIASQSKYIESLQSEINTLKELQAMKASEVNIEDSVAVEDELSSRPIITPTTVLLATGTAIATVIGFLSKIPILP